MNEMDRSTADLVRSAASAAKEIRKVTGRYGMHLPQYKQEPLILCMESLERCIEDITANTEAVEGWSHE